MAYTTLKTLALFPKVVDDIILSYIPHYDNKWQYDHYYRHAVMLELEHKMKVPIKQRIFPYTKSGINRVIKEQTKSLLFSKDTIKYEEYWTKARKS